MTSPISGVSSSTNSTDISTAASMNNNQIMAALMNGNIDNKFANLLISQMASNNADSILFGDQSSSSSGSSFDPFGSSDPFSSDTSNGNAITSQSILNNSSSSGYITPQFEMSVYSSLIGKTVTALDPSTGKQITNKVASVTVQNGKTVLMVGTTIIPPENLLKIQ
jgi:hypothetical protein